MTPANRRLAYASTAVVAGSSVAAYYYERDRKYGLFGRVAHAEAAATFNNSDRLHAFWTPPSRAEQINLLKGFEKDGITETESKKKGVAPFDLLIIGGGATGAGSALDGATRGLKVALVEKDDFAAGTSSRSTKLVHGGVRYLEKAFKELDYEQYKLVREALHERATFLKIAPFISKPLPIMLPIYHWWQVPYFWAGCKAYDLLAGKEGLMSSYLLTSKKALEAFPMLKNKNLCGALVYYDGQHNDSRMNVALALTAISHGAVVANHTEVTRLIKGTDEQGRENRVIGAVCKDLISGEEFEVRARGVINATGPFTDGIRHMDEPTTSEIVSPSAGVHVILPNYYSPRDMGLLDPATSDGRVIFFLPWEGNTIAGTTDSPTGVTENPIPKEEEITWILDEIRRYLTPEIKVRRGDVLAAWSGIRPLVRDPSAKNTEALVRNHMINISKSGLLTIAGGKWTTYRAMAMETIDEAIKEYNFKATGPCITDHTMLVGSQGYTKNMFIKLIQQYGLETEVAQHLANSYGDRAWAVAALAHETGRRWPIFGKRLAVEYPYIEAEIRFACRKEYAQTAVDVLARRTRLAFLNAQAALDALPRVVDVMAEELKWSKERKKKELEEGANFMRYMGLPEPNHVLQYPSEGHGRLQQSIADPTTYQRAAHQPEEVTEYRQAWSTVDSNMDGSINATKLKKVLSIIKIDSDDEDVRKAVIGLGIPSRGTVEYNEFLEIIASAKESKSRKQFSKATDGNATEKAIQTSAKEQKGDRSARIPTERSGGGV